MLRKEAGARQQKSKSSCFHEDSAFEDGEHAPNDELLIFTDLVFLLWTELKCNWKFFLTFGFSFFVLFLLTLYLVSSKPKVNSLKSLTGPPLSQPDESSLSQTGRAFKDPKLWLSPPEDVGRKNSVSSFKPLFKTHLCRLNFSSTLCEVPRVFFFFQFYSSK